MRKIFKRYLKAIDDNDRESIIYKIFLNYQSKEYLNNSTNIRMVIDFISGMTDEMFLHQINS